MPEHGILKFGLYQRVVSKKTGLPMVGSICGITTGYYQKWLYDCKNIYPKRWYDLYPNWPVYVVKFDQAARTLTYEEYLTWKGEPATREEYENQCPILQLETYPEDDLEPFEEEN